MGDPQWFSGWSPTPGLTAEEIAAQRVNFAANKLINVRRRHALALLCYRNCRIVGSAAPRRTPQDRSYVARNIRLARAQAWRELASARAELADAERTKLGLDAELERDRLTSFAETARREFAR